MKKKLFLTSVIVIIIYFVLYLFVLPALVANKSFHCYLANQVQKLTSAKLEIVEPVLKTSIKPKLAFSVNKFMFIKDNQELLVINNFDTEISFAKLFQKTLTLKKLGVDSIFVDVDKILGLLPQSEKHSNSNTQFKMPVYIDALNALLYVKDCKINATLNKNTTIKLHGSDIQIDDKRNPKFVKFHIESLLASSENSIKFTIDDNDKFYIKDKKLIIEECPLTVNSSKMIIRSIASEEKFTVSIFSKAFDIKDAVALITSNVFVPNGKELLAEIVEPNGQADFFVNLSTKGLRGGVDVKSASCKIRSLANMPVHIGSGKIKITPRKVLLEGFKGYYANSSKNSLSLEGSVDDYYNSVDTKVVISTIMTDDFTRKYLSKVVGCLITMTGDKPAGTRIEVNSKYADIDVVYMAKLDAGSDILIEGASLSPNNYDRAIKADMHMRGNILNIESINYYIAEELNKDSKVKPILTLHGNLDIMNNSNILDFGFNIPKPLPSEFLNVLIGQKVFKKGLIAGNLEYDNNGDFPTLEGKLTADKVIIPSHRLFIKSGVLEADKEFLNLNSVGKFRRSDYKFDGKIVNNLTFPIIVKDLNFTLDFIDIEKLLASAVAVPVTDSNAEIKSQEKFTEAMENKSVDDDSDDAALVFQPDLLVIERAAFNLKSGKFKELLFGNLQATASLDRKGNLAIDSNRFDFAEGISSAKIRCDLSNPTFWVRLGAKDINSDILATALLNLKREISGKASGLIILESDKSLKLNGNIKFAINDGTIEKVGLVEYALNFVSLFRNPMAMLSPSIVFDIVNIPEGKFEKISGDINIKDNVINRMKIESTAPQLATLIMGRFDLESRDASLRIYTKFANKNKGIAGVLRKLSLNSLANRVPFGLGCVENYYAAELEMLPALNADEKDCQVFLTTVDGDVERNNFLSSLKKIK